MLALQGAGNSDRKTERILGGGQMFIIDNYGDRVHMVVYNACFTRFQRYEERFVVRVPA